MGLQWLLLGAALAAPVEDETTCSRVSASSVYDIDAPAVIVLGERHGTQPDLHRANRLVSGLSRAAPVTLALEAVRASDQEVLDRYADHAIPRERLPSELNWRRSWGFEWDTYSPLVTAADRGHRVIGAGLPVRAAPPDAEVPIPPGYFYFLRDTMVGREVPEELQDRFVATMAYRDYSLATNAVQGWSGEGYLVVLVSRSHVEGGRGVSWQLEPLVSAPVHAFLLTDAGTECYPGDRVLK